MIKMGDCSYQEKRAMNKKPLSRWKPKDFYEESMRVNHGAKPDSDETRCGALLLAALVHGANLRRLTRFFGGRHAALDLEHYFENLKRNGVFRRNGKVAHAGWDDKKTGGLAFCLDVAVGVGYLTRQPPDKRKRKVG